MTLPNDAIRCMGIMHYDICPKREVCKRYTERHSGWFQKTPHPCLCSDNKFEDFVPVEKSK